VIRSVVALHNLINNKLALKEAENEGEKVCFCLQSSQDTIHASKHRSRALAKSDAKLPVAMATADTILNCFLHRPDERVRDQLVRLVCPDEQEKEDKDKEKKEDEKEKKDGKDDKEKDREKDKK
jgi:hypothetical protein